MPDYASITEQEMLLEEPYNADDREQVNKRANEERKRSARIRKEELDFVKAIMILPQGRKWMYNMLDTCKTFSNPIVPNDTHFTYHNIGEQNIGKKLLQDINDSSPDEYVLMMKEAREAK